jgi:hypothetical protein
VKASSANWLALRLATVSALVLAATTASTTVWCEILGQVAGHAALELRGQFGVGAA